MSYILIIIFMATVPSKTTTTAPPPTILTQEFNDPRLCDFAKGAIEEQVYNNPANKPAPRIMYSVCLQKSVQ